MNAKKTFKNPKIAVIPGDGIGKEVMPEGVRALEAANRKFGIGMQFAIRFCLFKNITFCHYLEYWFNKSVNLFSIFKALPST